MRLLLTLFLTLTALSAQRNEGWRRPFPAHKIVDNLYYVGTEDLACFLIATREGHILINTGLFDSTPLIRASIEKLGFRLEDVKILLTMQAHYDHVAAMQEIRKITGAKLFATEGDAPILEDGGRSDPAFGPREQFAPVKVDRRLKDGERIKLGGTELQFISTPGHSKGSASYWMTATEGGRKLSVGIINMGSVVMPLTGMASYPRIADDLAQSFEKQKKLSPDIWVAAHGSQYGMKEKFKAGSFLDPQGYKATVDRYERNFREQLAEARGQ